MFTTTEIPQVVTEGAERGFGSVVTHGAFLLLFVEIVFATVPGPPATTNTDTDSGG